MACDIKNFIQFVDDYIEKYGDTRSGMSMYYLAIDMMKHNGNSEAVAMLESKTSIKNRQPVVLGNDMPVENSTTETNADDANKIDIESEPAVKSVNNVSIKTYTNHSGGANGSDTVWGQIGEEYGVKSNHYFKDKTPLGNTQITEEQYQEGLIKAKAAAKSLGKNWSSKPYIQGLLARNWQQVKNSDTIFAIGTISGAHVNGGTGYAVEMAKANGNTIYVFDQERKNWYQHGDRKWVKIETPVLTENFAGIGTREINSAGEQAIRDVYEKTFGIKPDGPNENNDIIQQMKDIANGNEKVQAIFDDVIKCTTT